MSKVYKNKGISTDLAERFQRLMEAADNLADAASKARGFPIPGTDAEGVEGLLLWKLREAIRKYRELQ